MDRTAKTEARRAALARRNALAPEARAEAARAIAKRVAELPAWEAAGTVAMYVAIGSEVETRPLLALALGEGKRVAVPRTDAAAHDLTLHEVRALEELRPGAFRVPEPDPRVHRDLAPGEVDLVCVPGVAFDRMGHRLGYGRGFFDRFLARYAGASVGLCYEALLLDELPAEAHDVRVGLVVTEARVVEPRA